MKVKYVEMHQKSRYQKGICGMPTSRVDVRAHYSHDCSIINGSNGVNLKETESHAEKQKFRLINVKIPPILSRSTFVLQSKQVGKDYGAVKS